MGEKHSSDKADKAAMEKRRRRMLERADKLEAQAKELMAEAEKARARYTALTKAEEVSPWSCFGLPRPRGIRYRSKGPLD